MNDAEILQAREWWLDHGLVFNEAQLRNMTSLPERPVHVQYLMLGYVQVIPADGSRTGWIPQHRVSEFLAKHPEYSLGQSDFCTGVIPVSQVERFLRECPQGWVVHDRPRSFWFGINSSASD